VAGTLSRSYHGYGLAVDLIPRSVTVSCGAASGCSSIRCTSNTGRRFFSWRVPQLPRHPPRDLRREE
jgi:hypothetical protein